MKRGYVTMGIQKRLLAMFLSMILAALMAAPAFAAPEPPAPVVFLGGFFSSRLYLNDGQPDAMDIFEGLLSAGAIFGAMGGTLMEGLRDPLMVLRSPYKGLDALSDFALRFLENFLCDENGDSLRPVSNASMIQEQYSLLRGSNSPLSMESTSVAANFSATIAEYL